MRICLLIWKRGVRKREKHLCEREILISSLWYAPPQELNTQLRYVSWPRMQSATFPCVDDAPTTEPPTRYKLGFSKQKQINFIFGYQQDGDYEALEFSSSYKCTKYTAAFRPISSERNPENYLNDSYISCDWGNIHIKMGRKSWDIFLP